MKLQKIAAQKQFSGVAPRAGAWIETILWQAVSIPSESPPARGRGLKLRNLEGEIKLSQSPPARGRGLKPGVPAALKRG